MPCVPRARQLWKSPAKERDMHQLIRVDTVRLYIEMSGKLNLAPMEALLDEIIRKSKGIKHAKMRYDVVDFYLPSLGAIGIQF